MEPPNPSEESEGETNNINETREISNVFGGKNITLKSHQIEHFDRVDQIIQNNQCYLDCSVMGSGKTYIAGGISSKYGLKMMVICPKSVMSVWHDISSEYSLPLIDVISFETLRTNKNKQPKHPYLKRVDRDSGTAFFPTEVFEKLACDGILLILDEIHKIKNNNDQYKACKALANACLPGPTSSGQDNMGHSRFALLSGSPFDKEEHVVNLLRLIGYIRHPKLFTYNKDLMEIHLYGMGELIKGCESFDLEKTNKIREQYPIDHHNINERCYLLFIKILKDHIVSSMPPPEISSQKDVANGYYLINRQSENDLNEHIDLLSTAAKYNIKTLEADKKNADWGAITRALYLIETDKISILVRVAKKHLQDDSNCKVLLYVSYKNTIASLQKALYEFQPLIMHGETKEKNRKEITQLFQSPPDKSPRILIANIRVGGEGISLDDQVGNSPRYMFIVPNYSILSLHQATGRIYRQGTQSKATVRFVYGQINNGKREMSIINSLIRKKKVLREILDKQVTSGIKFPGEYPDFVEE